MLAMCRRVLTLLAHERVGLLGDRGIGDRGIASRIMLTIIFSNPIARNDTALAMAENAGLVSFHRKGTS